MIAVKAAEYLPHDLETEQVLLGTLMTFNETLPGVAAILTPDDFYDPLHARIFETIRDQIGEGKRCTALTLLAVFRDDETIKSLNMEPSAVFAKLAGMREVPLGALHLAQIVKDDATRRMLILTAEDIATRARKPGKGDTAAGIAAESLEAVSQIAVLSQGATQQHRFSAAAAADAVTMAVNDRFQHGVLPDNMAYPGSHTLTRLIGGWKRKRLYVIGGRPSMGKTTVGLSWLTKTAQKGHGVLYFSLEMEAQELTARMLTDVAWNRDMRTEYDRIDHGELEAWQVERLCTAATKIKDVPLVIDQRVGLTLSQVRATVQQVSQQMSSKGQRLDVVAIDHMGLLRASERYSGNKVAETEEVSAGLKALAKESDIAVVSLMQLSRAVEGRDNKRPTLSDLRWSGAIEQDADCVMFCYREAYYLEREKSDKPDEELARMDRLERCQNLLEINIAKNRGGKCANLEFFADIGCGVVRDMEGRS